jgi:hypothetical protein
MVRIAGNGETYEPVIYTDPGNPWRDVVGAYTVTVGMQVCVSGRVTGALCAITVVNTDYQWCGNPFGCTTWTFLARKSGQLVGQGGDSGAPVYTRPGATTADIHGMEIAGDSFDEMICDMSGSSRTTLASACCTASPWRPTDQRPTDQRPTDQRRADQRSAIRRSAPWRSARRPATRPATQRRACSPRVDGLNLGRCGTRPRRSGRVPPAAGQFARVLPDAVVGSQPPLA